MGASNSDLSGRENRLIFHFTLVDLGQTLSRKTNPGFAVPKHGVVYVRLA
jgi:hypothetical protein